MQREIEKVYGPYTMDNGRRIVRVKYKGIDKLRTVTYPKWKMEQILGRDLDPDLETVDHINGDFNDNREENIRLMPRDEHSKTDTRRVFPVEITCVLCGTKAFKDAKELRHNAKLNHAGPFCSKRCAGRYARLVSLKKMDRLPTQDAPESEYYKDKVAERINLLFKILNS